jgi:hypothetical protein
MCAPRGQATIEDSTLSFTRARSATVDDQPAQINCIGRRRRNRDSSGTAGGRMLASPTPSLMMLIDLLMVKVP